MNILEILEHINSDTKRTHKLDVIRQHKDNRTFLRVLKLALDPYVNFFIKKIPDYDPKGGQTLDWALAELEKLSSRQFTGHAGIEHLRHIMSGVGLNDAIVVSRIIGKDLRCGVADATVNAVIPGYIPTYPCLLARPYDDKNIKNIVFPAMSQLKADGVRANVHVKDNKVLICSRTGREIDLLGTLDECLISLAKHFDEPVVFDGELVVVDSQNKVIDRKTGNGIINKANKGTISLSEAVRVRLQLWDVIPVQDFAQGFGKEKYEARFQRLLAAIQSESGTECANAYWAIPYRMVSNLTEAEQHFQEMLDAGCEGTILKNLDSVWEDTRSKDLVKMKAEKDCDLEIIGWNPGTGQFEGQVGSLIMASSDRLVEASISGFSFDLRKYITENIDRLISTIGTVIYNERISSKSRNGVDSLFLPRFSEFRYDKKVADSSKEIK
jgi:hypothetical protein